MVVYMDASEDGPAASISDLGGKWRLYVNLLDFDSPEAGIEILTHEYRHILTLNKTQVQNITNEYCSNIDQLKFEKIRFICRNTFFTRFDFTAEKFYLNTFGHRFWSG